MPETGAPLFMAGRAADRAEQAIVRWVRLHWFGTRSLLGAAAAGCLAAFLLVLGVNDLQRLQRAAFVAVAHALEVTGAAATLNADLTTAVSEGRGFMLGQTPVSRTMFEAAARQTDADLAALQLLTADSALQRNAVERLAPLIGARVAAMRKTIERIAAGDVEAAMRSAMLQRARSLTAKITEGMEDIKAEERRLLERQSRAVRAATRWHMAGLVLCGVVIFGSALFAGAVLLSRGRERRHLRGVSRINAELEARVETRTAELAASEASFRLLAENGSDMVSRIGPDGRTVYVSPACWPICGVAPAELLDSDLSHLIHADDRAAVNALQTALLAGEVEHGTITFRIMNPQRGEVWVEVAVRALRHLETGAPDGTISVMRDVTERVAAEAAQRASEARYRVLAEATNEVITCLDLDYKCTYASPACLATFGYGPEELVGETPVATMHEEDMPEVTRRVRLVSTGRAERTTVTYRTRHREGHWVWVEATVALLRDGRTGAPASLVCALRDISERQARAEALRRARDHAERASRAKSRFLAGMSHELRTPLNGILGYAQLMHLEGGLTSTQTVRLDAMLGAGRHLLGMINRVLDLSEIETEQASLRLAKVDLPQVARDCLELVRPALETKGLWGSLAVAPGVPEHIMADETRLRQVLLNLLGNAAKFTISGTVDLRVGTAGAGGLRIEVVDTGPGIPPAHRHRLFREFDRLDADLANTNAPEGTGLGLALSARLAILMGGNLGYMDNPGGGSVFWLELPLRAGGITAPPPDAVTAATTSRLHVLVVDDVAMNRDIAGAFLRAAGHAVTQAECGADAIALAAETVFDVILMDVRMPGMDGLVATGHIRALAGPHGRVPVVALTAQAFAEQVEECRRAGMDGHLAKPFTQPALLKALAAATQRSGTGRPAAQLPVPPIASPTVGSLALRQTVSS